MTSSSSIPPINAVKRVVRSTGFGCESVFLLPPSQRGPSDFYSTSSSWRNDTIDSKDTTCIIELRSLYQKPVDATGVSVRLTVVAQEFSNGRAHSFPSTCLVSLPTLQLDQDFGQGGRVLQDIVVKEWKLSRDRPEAQTDISLKTLLNVMRVVDQTADPEQELSTSTGGSHSRQQQPPFYLGLRFVGCSDMSNSHKIAKISVQYVSSFGIVGSGQSSGSPSMTPVPSSLGEQMKFNVDGEELAHPPEPHFSDKENQQGSRPTKTDAAIGTPKLTSSQQHPVRHRQFGDYSAAPQNRGAAVSSPDLEVQVETIQSPVPALISAAQYPIDQNMSIASQGTTFRDDFRKSLSPPTPNYAGMYALTEEAEGRPAMMPHHLAPTPPRAVALPKRPAPPAPSSFTFHEEPPQTMAGGDIVEVVMDTSPVHPSQNASSPYIELVASPCVSARPAHPTSHTPAKTSGKSKSSPLVTTITLSPAAGAPVVHRHENRLAESSSDHSGLPLASPGTEIESLRGKSAPQHLREDVDLSPIPDARQQHQSTVVQTNGQVCLRTPPQVVVKGVFAEATQLAPYPEPSGVTQSTAESTGRLKTRVSQCIQPQQQQLPKRATYPVRSLLTPPVEQPITNVATSYPPVNEHVPIVKSSMTFPQASPLLSSYEMNPVGFSLQRVPPRNSFISVNRSDAKKLPGSVVDSTEKELIPLAETLMAEVPIRDDGDILMESVKATLRESLPSRPPSRASSAQGILPSAHETPVGSCSVSPAPIRQGAGGAAVTGQECVSRGSTPTNFSIGIARPRLPLGPPSTCMSAHSRGTSVEVLRAALPPQPSDALSFQPALPLNPTLVSLGASRNPSSERSTSYETIAMGSEPSQPRVYVPGSTITALPDLTMQVADGKSCVMWCKKHHSSSKGASSRLLILHALSSGDFALSMKSAGGQMIRFPESLRRITLGPAMSYGNAAGGPEAQMGNVFVLLPRCEVTAKFGLDAFTEPCIYKKFVSSSARCVVIQCKGSVVAAFEVDTDDNFRKLTSLLVS